MLDNAYCFSRTPFPIHPYNVTNPRKRLSMLPAINQIYIYQAKPLASKAAVHGKYIDNDNVKSIESSKRGCWRSVGGA